MVRRKRPKILNAIKIIKISQFYYEEIISVIFKVINTFQLTGIVVRQDV